MAKIYTKVAQAYTQEKDGVCKTTMWEMGKMLFYSNRKIEMFWGL